jgi:hypothetical protein
MTAEERTALRMPKLRPEERECAVRMAEIALAAVPRLGASMVQPRFNKNDLTTPAVKAVEAAVINPMSGLARYNWESSKRKTRRVVWVTAYDPILAQSLISLASNPTVATRLASGAHKVLANGLPITPDGITRSDVATAPGVFVLKLDSAMVSRLFSAGVLRFARPTLRVANVRPGSAIWGNLTQVLSNAGTGVMEDELNTRLSSGRVIWTTEGEHFESL